MISTFQVLHFYRFFNWFKMNAIFSLKDYFNINFGWEKKWSMKRYQMVHGCLKDRMNDWMKKCRHTWATLTAVLNLMFPLGCTWCSLLSNRPTSDVKVTNTSTVLWKIKNCENLRNHKLQSLKKKKNHFLNYIYNYVDIYW